MTGYESDPGGKCPEKENRDLFRSGHLETMSGFDLKNVVHNIADRFDKFLDQYLFNKIAEQCLNINFGFISIYTIKSK